MAMVSPLNSSDGGTSPCTTTQKQHQGLQPNATEEFPTPDAQYDSEISPSGESGSTSVAVKSQCDSNDTLFAKRDVHPISSQKSTSALSSFSSQTAALRSHHLHRHSRPNLASDRTSSAGSLTSRANSDASEDSVHRQHSHGPHSHNSQHYHMKGLDANGDAILSTSCDLACPSPPQLPPLHTDDYLRIRTPASAVPLRRSDADIGTRLPFSDSNGTSKGGSSGENQGNSDSNDHDSNDHNKNNQATQTAEDVGPADALLRSNRARSRCSIGYEPARAIMSTPSSPRDRDRVASPQTAPCSPHESVLRQQQQHPKSRAPLALRKTSSASTLNDERPSFFAGRNHRDSNASEVSMQSIQSSSNSPQSTVTSIKGSQDQHQDNFQQQPFSPTSQSAAASSYTPDFRATPRQIRNPRHPLYTPAVLRPTDSSSYRCARPGSLFAGSASQQTGSVSSPPSRSHWKRDNQTDCCRACARKFTFLERRHHCRKCGDIFCARDSRYLIGINNNLEFNLFGFPARACRGCSDAFAHAVLEAARLVADSPSAAHYAATGLASEATGSGGISISHRMDGQALGNQEVPIGSLKHTLPADWSWSTF